MRDHHLNHLCSDAARAADVTVRLKPALAEPKKPESTPFTRRMAMTLLCFGAFGNSGGIVSAYHRQLKLRCGISPCYDYHARNLSLASIRQTSATVLLEQVSPKPESFLAQNVAGRRVRVWQVVDGTLAVDHCSVSNIVVWIDETGRWSTSMKAIQNPFLPATESGSRQATPAARFNRNRFHVNIRALGLAPNTDGNSTSIVGEPEFFHLETHPFWVARDTSIQHSETGTLNFDQLQRLPLVDRIEVEFRYE